MRLKKVLHPEMVLKKRGNKEIIRLLRCVLDHVIWLDGPRKTGAIKDGEEIMPLWDIDDTDEGRIFKEVIAQDINVRDHYLHIAKWEKEKAPVYHVGKDFLNALMSINKDIPADLLPERFHAYISFPNNTVYDDTGQVDGAYVYLGDGGEIFENHKGQRVLWINTVAMKGMDSDSARLYIWLNDETIKNIKNGEPFKDTTEKYTSYDSHIKWKDSVLGMPQPVAKSAVRARSEVFNAILNVILYIHSQEPDVSHLRPDGHLSIRKRKEKEEKTGKVNECTLDVIAVNWGYKKPRQYEKDAGWWDTFLRWQRCGPKNQEVKLIWVKGHEKKFKKSDGQ